MFVSKLKTMAKKTAGGKRPGAGRKPGVPKKPIGKRVPVKYHTHFIALIEKELIRLSKNKTI